MDEVLKIAICENEASDADKLLECISRSDIPADCRLFTSGESFLNAYQAYTYDLLLVDIYLGGSVSGVDAAAQIRNIDAEVPLAFVTTSTEHDLAGYRLAALKYIEKPVSQRAVDEVLKIARRIKDSAPVLTVRKNRREEKIPLAQIIFLEQQTHQLHIHIKDGTDMQVYQKLSSFLPQLAEQHFFSPHKSYAVNLAFVRFIDFELKCFVMQNGANVPIRRESLGKSRQALADFLFERTRRIEHDQG